MIVRRPRIPKVILLLIQIFFFGGLVSHSHAHSFLQSLSRQQKAKLDAPTRMLLSDSLLVDDILFPCLIQQNRQMLVPTLIRARGDISNEVWSLGGFVGSRHGSIYTAYIPVTAIAVLARSASVEYIERAQRLWPSLDTSLRDNGTVFIHHVPPEGFRGRGVIIGITDSGIDLTHPDFMDSLGNTRVLYLWDQYDDSGRPPPGFFHGSEYDHEQLMQGRSREKDTNGHGTRVASIAAGNGNAGGFVGMAPEANLIIVKARSYLLNNIIGDNLNTAGILDGYAYIRMRAQELGMPFVINTSRGTTIGPHDGTTLLSQAVNAEVAAGATIVVSAGNYSDDRWHAEAIAQPGDSLTFKVQIGNEEKLVYLDFWYETFDQFQIEIAAPSHDFLEAVHGDTTVKYYEEYARVYIDSKMFSPLNQDNEFLIRLAGPMSGGDIPAGTWRFRFASLPGNPLPAGGEIDGWIIRDVDARFLNYVDLSETIGELATTDSVIAVAAYNNKLAPPGRIAPFSSIGPRRDGVLKPDLAAAGGGVVASRSQQSDDDPYHGNPYYVYGSGTSFSAPHVAGAVALLLEQNPSLTPGEIKRALWQSARQDHLTGPLPNTIWGYGKLDVIALLRSYLPVVPVSGDVRFQNKPIAARLHLQPFGVDYPDLERWFDLRPGALTFSTTLLAGRYVASVTPGLPFQILQETLSVPIDASDFNHTFETEVAEVVVIDDESADYEKYFLSALDSLPISYSYWADSLSGVPPLASAGSLMPNPVAVWFTGNERDSVLTAAEQDTLRSFLLNGGGLLMTGQNILESIDSSEFALRFLRSRFAGNTRDRVLQSVPSDPIFGEYPLLFISGAGGARNQTSCDILEWTGAADPVYYYDTTAATIGGISVSDELENWRLIFLGFGLEAVTVPVNRTDFISRKQMLARAIDWLARSPAVRVEENGATPEARFSEKTIHTPADLFHLRQNFPNPFNLATIIEFDLLQRAEIRLVVYDVTGREIAQLASGSFSPGRHSFVWNGRDDNGREVASGVYFCKLESRDQFQMRRLLLMK